MNEIEELNKQYLAMYDNYKSKLVQIDEELDNIGRYRAMERGRKNKESLYRKDVAWDNSRYRGKDKKERRTA